MYATDSVSAALVRHGYLTHYLRRGEIPELPEHLRVPLGQGVIRRHGSDVTCVAWGRAVWTAMKTADVLSKEGIATAVTLTADTWLDYVAFADARARGDITGPTSIENATADACSDGWPWRPMGMATLTPFFTSMNSRW